jgi:stearoyl-CoA desaturase (Delta-9 desaturase)
VAHWSLSLFFHSGFLHRYCSHKMYTLSPFMERAFYFLTWFFQGSSFLIPRAYAVMHRMHHEYSDTEKDPHSPHFFKDVVGMMRHTKEIYNGFLTGRLKPESRFCGDLPVWNSLDKFGDAWPVRVAWGTVYGLIYLFLIQKFDLSYAWMLLLPVHFLIGPVQGAIVNWCGHKYGYQNFKNGDHSKNSEVWGFALLGELFQNNHHKYPERANFAVKWYEIDPTYWGLKVLDAVGIIKLLKKKEDQNGTPPQKSPEKEVPQEVLV